MTMKITIRTLQRGKATFEIDAEPSETISELKVKICAKCGHPTESQNIIDSGKSLQDDKTIGACNIKETSPLVLVLRGAPTATGSSLQAPKPTPHTAAASTPDFSPTLHPSMQEKQRRQWPNISFTSSNDGPSFGAGAHAGLAAPASNSAPAGANVGEGTITLEEGHAIGRLEALGFPRNAVAQAFFACNKNEEVAANFLIDGAFK